MNQVIFQQLQQLLPQAKCPYSHFHVACILVTDQGSYSGFNVENAVYGNSMCAERVALYHALARGANNVHQIHLLTDSSAGLVHPCGSCRQTLSEFVAPNCQVSVYDHHGHAQVIEFRDYFPYQVDKVVIFN